MRRMIGRILLAAVVCGGLAMAKEEQAYAAARVEQSAAESDAGLAQALQKKDSETASALLDDEFTWTDKTGKTADRAAALGNLAALRAGEDIAVTPHDFGKIVLVTGTHRNSPQDAGVRFIRVWLKQPGGWKALVYQETKIAEKAPEHRQGFGSPSGGAAVECENPCKTVPYQPEGAAEREVVAMWQAVERTVLANDAEAWIPNFTDDFVFVTPDGGTPLGKNDRIVMIRELKKNNTVLIPPQVVSMKVWALGDTAVMRSEHKPLKGRTLHVTRIFVKREGHWQIAFGQQTSIEGSEAPGH